MIIISWYEDNDDAVMYEMEVLVSATSDWAALEKAEKDYPGRFYKIRDL